MAFYDSHVDVLKQVARRLRRPPDVQELDDAEKAGVWQPTLPAWDEQDVDMLVRHLRAHAPRVEIGERPGHWLEHSAWVMGNFKEQQSAALALFGLDEPLGLSQVAPFLCAQAKSEPPEGDLLSMTLPDELGHPTSAIGYARGYFEDERIRKLRECRQAASPEELKQRLTKTQEWAKARSNPLYRFSLIVQGIVEDTEIPAPAAIGFLLGDAPVLLPRLAYSPTLRMGGKNPRLSLTLSIFDLDVEPGEVERAYRHLRSEMLQGVIFPSSDRGPRRRLRTMGDRTREMLTFCRARDASQKFPVILKEWNAAHPQWAYASPKSLYSAYQVAEDRWGMSRRAK